MLKFLEDNMHGNDDQTMAITRISFNIKVKLKMEDGQIYFRNSEGYVSR